MSTSSKENPMVILVIVLVLVILALWVKSNGSVPVDNGTAVPTVDVTPDYINPNSPLTYARALTLYKDARIQLGVDCQASPNYVTYKNGTSIMIDNR
ncbi:MAG: hypothetical protein NTV24_05195, partial [Candidatus Woesebacteria bacterium]|nr:hypothetical protein [Candidatus Woesebacteria bacterium]